MSDQEKSGAIRFPDFEQVVLKFEPVCGIQCAERLSHEVGIDVDTLQQITEHLPWGFQPITPAVIADQQKIADAFFALNLIPKKLAVREATLPAFPSSKEGR
jgi:hypothetical protein